MPPPLSSLRRRWRRTWVSWCLDWCTVLWKTYIQELTTVVCTPDAGSSARKAPENVWRPDSSWTCWGSFSTPQTPSHKKGKGKGRREKGGNRKGRRRKGVGKGKGVRGGREKEKGRGGKGREGRRAAFRLSFSYEFVTEYNTNNIFSAPPTPAGRIMCHFSLRFSSGALW